MTPAYKLTYFDRQGAAECIRFLFKYGGIDFEDIRITKEEWPALKHKTPFGHLPFLEHKGKIVTESVSICRYLGKIANLASNDDWENLEIDSIVDTIYDMRYQSIKVVRMEQDASRKKTMKEKSLNEIIPNYFTRLEAVVEKNNGYLALGRLTWADLYFVSMCPGFDYFAGGDVFEKYPNLKALRTKVEALSAIKEWIRVRPQSEY
ncbi:hypothetical protein Zmor_007740 [Zophobas morio]|uniref:glutathione transferase n=1 Tax=Zophobas morio TaxID=2755281 RepID=A0AA38IU37_9CUCU|nr:hypothetical protein Zmor_007740 [Zophobas morio]